LDGVSIYIYIYIYIYKQIRRKRTACLLTIFFMIWNHEINGYA
jgi:hypothetical protein